MLSNVRANFIAEFSHAHAGDEDYANFYGLNDIGVPLAISLALNQVTLREEGEKYLDETWKAFCEIFGADSNEDYASLEELMKSGGLELSVKGKDNSAKLFGNDEITQAVDSNSGGIALTSVEVKIDIMGQFVSEFEGSAFDELFDANERGLSLALASLQEIADLTDAGIETLNKTWIEICALFAVDPMDEYLELTDLLQEEDEDWVD
jgi:hypothetical protein